MKFFFFTVVNVIIILLAGRDEIYVLEKVSIPCNVYPHVVTFTRIDKIQLPLPIICGAADLRCYDFA